jgi:ABC-type uncharacterized transport system ATPase subunit
MNVYIIEGYLGAGKTLCMSILAKYYQERSGCTLYSNYGLKGAIPFTNINQFLDVAVQPSSILCLDEAHIDLDARNFSTNNVKFFTALLFYLRKMRCTIFLTSPLFENLDTRVRGISNIYCRATKDKHYFRYTQYDLQSERLLKALKIKKENAFKIASQIYETNSIVSPLIYPQDRKEFEAFLEQLKRTVEAYYLGVASQGA